MTENTSTQNALRGFADAVQAKLASLTIGEPEDQLRAPFETFLADVARAFGLKIVCTGETLLPGRLGKPDYAVHVSMLLAGYVELKAPGTGADVRRFKGHNRNQWRRFAAIPNILYTDGNEWGLYRDGQLVGKIVRLSGDITADGRKAATADDASALEGILQDFLAWQPIIPTDRKGKIDLERFAKLLAPLCRLLRDDVADALKDSSSPLVHLAKDWRQLLFPDASNEQFADAYAQTVAFALLLGRSEGADPLTLESAEIALVSKHNLLSRALQVLTDSEARGEIAASLNLLLRIVGVVAPAMLSGPEDPWLYFYEDFLAAYDPKLRKDAGAYYTPVQVVRAQVRLIDELLVNRLGKSLGFVDSGVVTLDPAVGTGTYLLGVIEHALERVKVQQGPGAVAGQATALAANLYAFEIMVGPYAVAELRVSGALRKHGASLAPDGTHIYLTDTLENPHAVPPILPYFLQPIAEQHAKALKVKSSVPVIVCLGNPPYDRHEAASDDNKARTGGWVRWGDWSKKSKGGDAIFQDFLAPAVAAGHGVHVKNLYNLYVYFWRWALWKVFEHETAKGPGVVSFISASSYLGGDAFGGMREHMRRICDEIWILDLGGEGRGTRKTDNVFAIQTPVAIAVVVRLGKTRRERPAKVHYARIEGDRESKLAALNDVIDFTSVKWQLCPDAWQAPFHPAGKGDYFTWPFLTDLMPWQHSGVQFKRTWPISPEPDVLRSRWRALLKATDKARLFKETRDRKIDSQCPPLSGKEDGATNPINQLPRNAPTPRIEPYAYRSFDRQWVLADSRLGDFLRPDLWRAHGNRQVYLTTLLNHPLGQGPAVVACAEIPDLHHFRGSYGAKEAFPLYRTEDGTEPNIVPGLLHLLVTTYNREIAPEDFLAYIYGVLAQPAFTARYRAELETRELRVPITKDRVLFEKVRAIGTRLLWLQTYATRFVPKGRQQGQVPSGSAKCIMAVPGNPSEYPESFDYDHVTQTLRVGKGTFRPVATEVYNFEVSGLKVVHSWLNYRMKEGAGRKSSPLHEIRPERWTGQFTTELLQFLWVLEATLEAYPEQATLLEAVVAGPCFQEGELPRVPYVMRQAPARHAGDEDLIDPISRARLHK